MESGMTSMLGIGPRPIDIRRVRMTLAIAGILAAAVVLAVPAMIFATRVVEIIAGGLIATLLYEPFQQIAVPTRIASTIGTGAIMAGVFAFALLAGWPHEFSTIGAQFVFTTVLATLMLGCIFLSDRMRTIWHEQL
jgi:hypothetical protein